MKTLNHAWEATNELKRCTDFVTVLKYVLAIGNYVNAKSTKFGKAFGFKLSDLAKVVVFALNFVIHTNMNILQLAEYKDKAKKNTLLHYLIHQLHDNQPNLLSLPEQMKAVSMCARTEGKF